MNRFYRVLLVSALLIVSVVLVVEAEKDEATENYTKWELPKAAKARFGKGGINAIQFSPDGTQIAVGSSIGVWIYDLKTGKEIDMLPGRSQSIAFSPGGRFIASGGGKFAFRGGGLQLWETATGQKVALTDGHRHRSASALQFSEDGKTLVTLEGWGDAIGRLDVETGKTDVKNVKDRSWERMTRRSSPEPYALTHDKFAVGGQVGKIELWDTTTGEILSTLSGHGGPLPPVGREVAIPVGVRDQMFFPDAGVHVLVLKFSPDGTKLASAGAKATMFFEAGGSGATLATQMGSRRIQVTEARTGRELATLNETDGVMNPGNNSITFSPDGKTVAFDSSGKIYVWNTETGNTVNISLIDEERVPKNPNNADGNGDFAFPPGVMPRHITPSISALVFSSDGKKLISGNMGGKVQMWDAETGVALAPFLAGQDMEEAVKGGPGNFTVNI